MSEPQFVHLHVHTEYSLLDGAGRIRDLIARAKELGMPALAITDHGNMYGAIQFYQEAKKQGIKPIIGCELYVAPRAMDKKEGKQDAAHQHLVLLAKNDKGYRNIIKLVSKASIEGFYYKPRIDLELLKENCDGLVALSGCLAGKISRKILENNMAEAREHVLEYKEIFGEDFYLEIQNHGLAEQVQVRQGKEQLAAELDVKLIATNDVHYVYQEDAAAQDVLICIQTGSLLKDTKRMKFQSQDLYLRSPQEMMELFQDMPSSISNSLEIADKCNFEMELGKLHFPDYEVPSDETPDTYLRKICEEGVAKRYPNMIAEVKERLEYELGVIKNMGYAAYFLIVQDFVNYAKNNNIQVGPGRGSAAGSIVAYSINITNIDPLKYNLLFERFLNPERISMPDIDIDFCYVRRQEVIDYVSEKYGADHVAQIVTFGTMAARAAIRDVGRVMDVPLSEVDKIAKMIPEGVGITLKKALETNSEFQALCQKDRVAGNVVRMARKVEGLARHAGTHAAGVVITDKPLLDLVPIQKMKDQIQTQFTMNDLETLGLLKMDFLGLRNLTMVADTIENVKQIQGKEIDIPKIPIDDKETYDLLCRGETIGVFQLESKGMRGLIKDLHPRVFEDVIALLALYRPGPLGSGMVQDFIKNKKGEQQIKYEVPELETILKETYGLILYQEQVMQIASVLGGFTLGKADVMRKAMGKKKLKVMAEMGAEFVEGSVKNNIPEKKAKKIFALCEKFAEYGFNKSHSAAYAVISYQTAYLKANYPLEFMASLLTSVSGDTDKVSEYIAECNRMGIDVLPPNINESRRNFTVSQGSIRFGFSAIKNLGEAAIQNIIKIREQDGAFISLSEFFNRVDSKMVNKRGAESLVKSGGFDSFGFRAAMMQALAPIMEGASRRQKERESGQVSLFGDSVLDDAVFTIHDSLPDVLEWKPDEKLKYEKEMLGLYISDHPLKHIGIPLETLVSDNSISIKEKKDEEHQVVVAGLLKDVRKIITRTNKNMLIGKVEDLRGTIPLVVFPGRPYDACAPFFENDNIVLIKGKTSMNRDEVQVVCASAEILAQQDNQEIYHIELEAIEDAKIFSELQNILKQNRGAMPVILHTREKAISTSREFWVKFQPELKEQVEEVIGKGRSWVG
jgi:DNA polymerase III subunit alpha